MSPGELGAEALGLDPSRITSVALLRDGLTNDSWLVRTADAAVVVRINNPNAQALQVDREAEASILRIVAAAGIGPEVLLCDPARYVLVTRYLGPTCSQQDMHAPSRIERVGRLLRHLHSLALPASVAHVRWQDVITDYVGTLNTMNRDTPLLGEDISSRTHAIAVEIESESVSVRSCLCHNDVHHLNLIDTGPLDTGKLRLLDWEYAGIGEPYFDLASVAFYNEYTLEQRTLLLAAYEGSIDPAALQRLAKTCLVFEYVHNLWYEVRAAVEPGV
jgi:thiamine kinase